MSRHPHAAPDADIELVARTLLAEMDAPSFEGFFDAFAEIFRVALRRPDLDLSSLSLVPELADVQKAARAEQAQRDSARARAQWLAELPSAAELLLEAGRSADPFEFHGYSLWREGAGWSLTNAYGVDNCGFLSVESDFEWLLRKVRAGEEIGPVPPYCEDPPDDPDLDYQIDSCHDAALSVSRRIVDPDPVRSIESGAAPDLFDMALAARIEQAMVKILQAGGDRDTPEAARHRARAYALAESAGYAFELAPPPNLVAHELDLLRAWIDGVARRQREARAAREQRTALHAQLQAVLGASASLVHA
ncbi:hypothetical protein [Paraburkholderia youngii]|uniref:hypothetical protein n=1 Tax=Paraburkholderia youngii TaxID=2782701 RepID=UPI003D22B40B